MRKELQLILFKTSLWAFLLLNSLFLSAQKLSDGFEGAGISDFWTITYGTGNVASASISSDFYYEGTQSLKFDGTTPGTHNIYMVSPMLLVTEGDQEISFQYMAVASGTEVFRVGWSSTGSNPETDFTWSEDIVNANTGWQSFLKNDLPIGTKYICIQYKSPGSAVWLFIDGLVGPNIYTKPNDDAGVLLINGPASGSATGSYELTAYVKNYGAQDLTSVQLNVEINGVLQDAIAWNNTISADGTALVSLGTYEFLNSGNYLVKVFTSLPNGNTDGDVGNDSKIKNFNFVKLVSAFPYLESFENSGALPEDWKNEHDNTRDWEFKTYVNAFSSRIIENDHTTGEGYFALFNGYAVSQGYKGKLTTPIFNIDTLKHPVMEFYWNSPKSESLRLRVNIFSNGTWKYDVIPGLEGASNGWKKSYLYLDDYVASDLLVQFESSSDGSNLIGVDDFGIREREVMKVDSIKYAHVSDSIAINGVNMPVLRVGIYTSNDLDPLTVTNINFSTNGSTNALQDLKAANCWFSAGDSLFSETTVFGTEVGKPNQNFNFTGQQVLAEGENYFWLTYSADESNAVAANIVDAEAIEIKISEQLITPENSTIPGSLTILDYAVMPLSGSHTIKKCNYKLYDDGGPYKKYNRNVNSIVTLYPVNKGDVINITIDTKGLPYSADVLEVYNGSSATDSLIASLRYNSDQRFVTFESNAANGAITLKMDGSNYSYGSSEGFSADVICITPQIMTYVSSKVTQNQEIVDYNTQNQQIIGIEIFTEGTMNPVKLTEFKLNTQGCLNPAADIKNARIWYTQTDNNFSTQQGFGNTVAQPDGKFKITGNIDLMEGNNYFWLTYDINQDANRDNFVDAQCDSIVLNGEKIEPDSKAPYGNRTIRKEYSLTSELGVDQIIKACDIMFYDQGGKNGDYTTNTQNGESVTFYPYSADDAVMISFKKFDVMPYDVITIYDNSSETGKILGVFDGNAKPNEPIMATNPEGCLTVNFNSNGIDEASGWEALVSCYTPPLMEIDTVIIVNQGTVVPKGGVNSVMYAIDIRTKGFKNPLLFHSLAFNTEGTTNINDLLNAKLFSTVDSKEFSTFKQVGATLPITASDMEIAGDVQLVEGSNYFWLTLDISENATEGNIVDIVCQYINTSEEAFIPKTEESTAKVISDLVIIPSGTGNVIDNCGYIICDDGGLNANYSNSFSGIVTLNPIDSKSVVSLEFMQFKTSEFSDILKVYNGSTVEDELLKELSGLNIPDPVTSSASNGALTLDFTTNSYTNNSGWVAEVKCLSTDNTLAELLINGVTYEGLNEELLSYDVILPEGTTELPNIEYVLSNSNAVAIYYPLEALPGIMQIQVTSENGNVRLYTFNISVEKAPVVSQIEILGSLSVGEELLASYIYNDENGDIEGSTEIKWYASDDSLGINITEIANGLNYTLSEEVLGKFICLAVEPVALTGAMVGEAVKSEFYGPVKAPLSTENDILSFSLNEFEPPVQGLIIDTNQTVSLAVQYGTDITALIPTIEVSEKATILPLSGTVIDFSSPVEFTVTAENGEEKKYEVSVSILPNTENNIVSFKFSDFDPEVLATIDLENQIVKATVPFGTNLTALVPTIEVSAKAEISPNTGIAQDFNNDVLYLVTAQSGDKKTFVASVEIAKNSESKMLSFVINNFDKPVEGTIDHIKKKVNIKVPFGSDITALSPEIAVSENATINPENGQAVDFSNVVEYTVIAEDSSTTVYKVFTEFELNSACEILSFKLLNFSPALNAEISDDKIIIKLPGASSLSILNPEIEISEDATITPGSGVAQDFSDTVSYLVTAANGNIKKYKAFIDTTSTVINYHNLEGVSIFPNPVKDILEIDFNETKVNLIGVEIIDTRGKVLINRSLMNNDRNLKINLSKYIDGVYLLKLISQEGIWVHKIMISN